MGGSELRVGSSALIDMGSVVGNAHFLWLRPPVAGVLPIMGVGVLREMMPERE